MTDNNREVRSAAAPSVSGRISERDRSTDHQEHTLPLHDGLDYPLSAMG